MEQRQSVGKKPDNGTDDDGTIPDSVRKRKCPNIKPQYEKIENTCVSFWPLRVDRELP